MDTRVTSCSQQFPVCSRRRIGPHGRGARLRSYGLPLDLVDFLKPQPRSLPRRYALDSLVFRCCRREDGLVAGGGPPRPATGGFRVRSKDRIRQLRLGFYEGIVAAGWIPLSSSPLFPAIAIKAFSDARSPGFVTGPNQGLAIVHRSTNIAALHSKPLPIHNGPRTAPCETSPTRSPVS